MKRRLLLALASGLVGVLAFPPFGVWPLAMLSVAGLSSAVHGRRCRHGAWLGFAFGVGLFAPMLHWTSTYVGAVPWLVLVFSQTWYLAALGAVLPLVARLRWAPVFTAALWVAEEALRDRLPFGGFPWGRWAFSQSESPLKWFAALGGAPLVSFMVALAGAGLAAAIVGRPAAAQPAWAAGVLAAGGRGSWWSTGPRRGRLGGAVLALLVIVVGAGLACRCGQTSAISAPSRWQLSRVTFRTGAWSSTPAAGRCWTTT
ncbi:MAG: hypothetical protein ABI140_07505 [Jatrophihabitantaceae bacterium]